MRISQAGVSPQLPDQCRPWGSFRLVEDSTEGLRTSKAFSPAELTKKQPEDDSSSTTQRQPALLTLQRIRIRVQASLCTNIKFYNGCSALEVLAPPPPSLLFNLDTA